MPSRPHLRIGSIPVHVEWPFFLIAALLGASGMRAWPGNRFVFVLVWVAIVFVSVLVHELGHAIAYRVYGQRPRITFTAFWGLTHGEGGLSRNQSIIVSLSGSALAMAVLGIPAILLRDWAYTATGSIKVYQIVYYLGFVNLWWSLANLLPLLPLDGGQVVRTIWGLRTARIASIASGAVVAIWLFFSGYSYAGIFIGVLAMMNLGEAMSEGLIGRGGYSVAGGYGGYSSYEDPPPKKKPKRRRRLKPGRRSRKNQPPLSVVGSTPHQPSRPSGSRLESGAWDALRNNDYAAAAAIVANAGDRLLDAYLVASVSAANGEVDQAVEQFNRAFGTSPTPPNLVVAKVIATSGIAERLADRLLDDPTVEIDATAELQNHLHYAGAFTAAARVGELLVADGRRSVAQSAYEVACSWARAGDPNSGLRWLERAVTSGFHARRVIETEDDLATVRTLPGYRDVVAAVGES